MHTPADAQRVQQDADALVREIVHRDRAEPGFALVVARLLLSRLPSSDARALLRPAQPPDPAAMIG